MFDKFAEFINRFFPTFSSWVDNQRHLNYKAGMMALNPFYTILRVSSTVIPAIPNMLSANPVAVLLMIMRLLSTLR